MENGTVTEFGVLGPLRVVRAGRLVALPAAKQRIAFATLLLHANEPVSLDRLIEYLWDGEAPHNARGALHTHIARLRRVLRDTTENRQAIRTLDGGYVLQVPTESVDVERFRDLSTQAARRAHAGDIAGEAGLLRNALDLWRGPVLADVPSASLHGDQVPRLHEDRARMLERWFDLNLRLGNHDEIVPDIRAVTAEHPLRERLWEQLILALYRGERRAEALEAYQTVATLLREELGMDPTTELRDLHQAVLTADPALDLASGGNGRRHALTSITPAPSRTPRQLPSRISRFTGRAPALARLGDLLSTAGAAPPRPNVIVTISGAAGVGKTALAIHWAHQVQDRFPDGQLYLDLRGFGGGPPVEPAAALEMLLGSLGAVADQVPAELDARAALLRSRLAGRRVVLLLDNAQDDTQVRALLPGSEALVVVTSRNRLSGLATREGAHHVPLGQLTEDESLRLMGTMFGPERIGAERHAAAEVAALCGHLPLALVICMEHAGRRPDAPLTDLIQQLRDERARLDLLDLGTPEMSLRGAFSCSYEALQPPVAKAFRLLALHQGPDLSLRAAAAFLGTTQAEARRLTESLTDRCLLEAVGRDRYRFHGLMRVYAAERADADDTRADRLSAIRRGLSWYLRTAANAGLVVDPHHQGPPLPPPEPGVEPETFTGYQEALTWLETEHLNLTTALRHVGELGEYDAVRRLRVPCEILRPPAVGPPP